MLFTIISLWHLGFTFSTDMKWNDHIELVARSAALQGWFISCQHFSLSETILNIRTLTIRLRIEYFCLTWSGCLGIDHGIPHRIQGTVYIVMPEISTHHQSDELSSQVHATCEFKHTQGPIVLLFKQLRSIQIIYFLALIPSGILFRIIA